MAFLQLVFLTCIVLGSFQNGLFEKIDYPTDVMEDSNLDTYELIRKYNYPAETHFITTEDNYILCLHRISKPGGKPILLQHGLLDSSVTYIIMGPQHGLGYYLYDMGYDVWLGNARGNRYSRNHTSLDPNTDSSFWNFSWHEIGLHDIPAMIDYILKSTNSERLHYVGHSQGTTVLFVMGSMRPQYNNKIILAHCLAPIAFIKHIKLSFKSLADNSAKVFSKLPSTEFLPHSDILKNMCLGSKQMEDMCVNSFFSFMGKDVEQFNKTAFPKLLGHLPAGIAVKQALHYHQIYKSDSFCQYDYGLDNQKVYLQSTPPDYPLEKVTVPIALYYGENDYLCERGDVLRLKEKLPNVVKLHRMEHPQWNHMDYLYAIDARKMLYEDIEKIN